jgi:hypothetical protein
MAPTTVLSESSSSDRPSSARFSATPRSFADWKRVSGFLESALLTTESKSGVIALLSDDGSAGSSWMIFLAMVQAPLPVNGFSPVRNW